MYILAMIVLILGAVIGLIALNQGPMDKESKRREAHWSKYDKN